METLKRRVLSHPTRDVWVEMQYFLSASICESVTSHTGCVSRNLSFLGASVGTCLSHPTRDVWVEISNRLERFNPLRVTSHTGCVSRNTDWLHAVVFPAVTSHTGCVSRNLQWCKDAGKRDQSHPTRDVWVEIVRLPKSSIVTDVTSHTGCVSRN